ncbi:MULTISPECIES: sensor histidine kinase [Paenibacillus]|uniref:HAMP domain protein n=2 Tax=Paenibacillus macerans TaxID=44252 RepID=A0A090ZK52_PAEMA|nr:sensor histidine kinase [Paenibacillus macerans]KFN10808.1 HAMP domain protein [Paenibacillus macerans]MBS5914154.1 sensor histidine kinase [Paenibacillus macerans]MEC0152855.1 sensor histidine kinase [Paenibacillus macerans]MEC0334017.1 sensor histidine kinase [Paenibacillus macerans]MUG21550.1 sensor histidine kinase [Paenibacillus macerans]
MTNPFKKYRIDSLFFRSFAVLMILVLLCIAWASYRISSNSLVRTSSHYQQLLLDELNNEISTRLVMIEQISLSTSRDNELITFLRDRQDEYDRYRRSLSVEHALANLTYSIPLIQGIDLYMQRPLRGDANSYIQFRSLDDLAGQDFSKALANNDFAWSGKHEIPSFQGDVPVLSFARKIVEEDKYLGVLVVHVKAREIEKLLAGPSAAANRMMIDTLGEQTLEIGQTPRSAELSRWIDVKSERSGYVHIRGGEGLGDSLLVYSKPADSHWMLVEITDWSDITSSSFGLALVIGLIGIGAMLLVLLLTHYLSRQFTKPIKQLVAAMRLYFVDGNNVELPGDYENEFGYLFSGYRKQNERIEELYRSLQRRYEQQRKAEIEALQANINPHFLYNMLDQLNWMAIEAGQDELSRILELMGRMFRIGLSNGDSFITVSEELEHIRCYLEIQQLRWQAGGGELTYDIHAPYPLQELFLPKLTLQPFVENAIVHGFNARSEGHIAIALEDRPQQIRIVIEDNGSGLKPSADRRPKRRTGGYGIRNVKERIAGYFEGAYGVELSDREEGGTRVVITLPRLQEPPVPPVHDPFEIAESIEPASGENSSWKQAEGGY